MSAVRLAVRTLARDRGFATAVVLSLALGIGANTAIFSLINTVLLRPLPYQEPARLYGISEVVPTARQLYPRLPANLGHVAQWRKRCGSLQSISVFQARTLNLTATGEPELVAGARMSANSFDTLGIRPQLGRTFFEQEDRKGNDHVVLLSDSLWKRRFAGDRTILGRKITLDGEPYEVIGVLPPDFRLLLPPTLGLLTARAHKTDIFKPLGYTSEDLKPGLGDFNYTTIARLRPGVRPATALSELNVAQMQIVLMLPEKTELRAELAPLHDEVVGRVRLGLTLVMSAVAAVLLILCVNLANLSLARAARRARDFAVRTALGASRAQIVREVLTESVLLAVTGGVLGIALAYAGLQALLRTAPLDIPRLADTTVDGRVLLFALVTSVLSGIAFGVLPALRSWGAQPQDTLKSGATTTENRRGIRTRDVLVGIEVGLSTVLLIIAALLISSFDRLMNVDKGYDIESTITAEISLPSTIYGEASARTDFYDRLLRRAEAMPAVVAAGIVSVLPLQGETWIDRVGVEHDSRPMFERPSVNVRFISPGYFKALGIPLRDGRMFADSDRVRRVAIISANVAQKLWPGQMDVVGRKMLHNDKVVEVIGVVPDLRMTSLDKTPVPMLYIPHWQRSRLTSSLVIRTAMDARGSAGSIRRLVWEIDPQVPVDDIRTMSQVMSDSVAQRRFQLLLVVIFAAAALGLASLGIYGVVAYSVARRQAEIGIRMALGAGNTRLYRMLVGRGMAPVLVGIIGGTVVALTATRVLASLLFEVSAHDPLTYSAVPAFLIVVAAVACVVPARHSVRLDPMRALRSE